MKAVIVKFSKCPECRQVRDYYLSQEEVDDMKKAAFFVSPHKPCESILIESHCGRGGHAIVSRTITIAEFNKARDFSEI